MGHATVREFSNLDAIINNVANASKKSMEAANVDSRDTTNNGVNPVAPVVLCGDDVRQGVTGHNVRYVLWFGLLGAVVGLAVVALVVGQRLLITTRALVVTRA